MAWADQFDYYSDAWQQRNFGLVPRSRTPQNIAKGPNSSPSGLDLISQGSGTPNVLQGKINEIIDTSKTY